MKHLILLVALSGALSAQTTIDGITIPARPGSAPRLLFGNSATLLARATSWWGSHSYALPDCSGSQNADLCAFRYLMTGTATDCTATATGAVGNLAFPAVDFEGGGSDNTRYYGEVVAQVYDWCYSQLGANLALIRDRWGGAVSNSSDHIHSGTDGASTAGSSVFTSASAPFLSTMAGTTMASKNFIQITGAGNGHCKTNGGNGSNGIYAIIGFTSSSSVSLDADPTDGTNAASCPFRVIGYVIADDASLWQKNGYGSNYFYGRLRNDIEWGIVLTGDFADSGTILDLALKNSSGTAKWNPDWTNYSQGLMSFASPVPSGNGGIGTEGSEYGRYAWDYLAIPMATSNLLGRNLFAETTWPTDAAYWYLYFSTTNQAVWNEEDSTQYPQMFAFNDVQDNFGFSTSVSDPSAVYIGDAMSVEMQQYSGTNLGAYARQWLTTNAGYVRPYVSAVDPGGSSSALTGLPLDYYSPGLGMLSTKNTWATTGTQCFYINAWSNSGSHIHYHDGHFACLRNGVWMTRAPEGYSLTGGDQFTGAYGSTAWDGSLSTAHNLPDFRSPSSGACGSATLTNGIANTAQALNFPRADSVVQRLESQANYSYLVSDLTGRYRADTSDTGSNACRDDNPYVNSTNGVVREFLFIKPLETLVIFDRLQSTYDPLSGDTQHPNIAATAVLKVEQIHATNAATSTTSSPYTATFDGHGQRMKVYTLLPATPGAYTVVDEASTIPVPAHRLEITDSGAAQSYELNVMQFRDNPGTDFSTATVTDNGGSYSVCLIHPTLGTASVTIIKGAASSGGTFGYAASGTCPSVSQSALATSVNAPTVTTGGVTWPSGVTVTSPANGSVLITQ